MTDERDARDAAVLAHVRDHPGLTAGELARVVSGTAARDNRPAHRALARLEAAGLVRHESVLSPHNGRPRHVWTATRSEEDQ
jgi:predicted ArsR family transcriptional regulator